MTIRKNWTGWVEFLGVLAFFLGAIDPMEGSTIILFGSALIALTAYLKNRKRKKGFLMGSISIAFGVAYMILIPLIPGGNPIDRNHWLLAPAVLYPIGWILIVVLLSMRVFNSHHTVQKVHEPLQSEVKPPVTAPIQLGLTKKTGKKPKRIIR